MPDATSLNLNASPLAMSLGAGSTGVASSGNLGLMASDPAQAEIGASTGIQSDFQAMLAAQTSRNDPVPPLTSTVQPLTSAPDASTALPITAPAPKAVPAETIVSDAPVAPASAPVVATVTALERNGNLPVGGKFLPVGVAADFAACDEEEAAPETPPVAALVLPEAAKAGIAKSMTSSPRPRKAAEEQTAGEDKHLPDQGDDEADDSNTALVSPAPVAGDAPTAAATTAVNSVPDALAQAATTAQTSLPGTVMAMNLAAPQQNTPETKAAPVARNAATVSAPAVNGTPNVFTQEASAQTSLPGTVMAMNLAAPQQNAPETKAAPVARDAATVSANAVNATPNVFTQEASAQTSLPGPVTVMNLAAPQQNEAEIKAVPVARDDTATIPPAQPASRIAKQNAAQPSEEASLPVEGHTWEPIPSVSIPTLAATSTAPLTANFEPVAPAPSGPASFQASVTAATVNIVSTPGTDLAGKADIKPGQAQTAPQPSGLASLNLQSPPVGATPPMQAEMQADKPVTPVIVAVSAQMAQWPLMAALPEAAKASAPEAVTAPAIEAAKTMAKTTMPLGAIKDPARTVTAASEGTDQAGMDQAAAAPARSTAPVEPASVSRLETTTPHLRDTLSFTADPLSNVANSSPARMDMPDGFETSRDMSALVDRLVETRAAMRSSTPSQWVSTSIQHAEFGRVGLQIRQDGGDLSVAMSSQDPNFAPAAQAALHGAQSLLQPAASSQSSGDAAQDNRQPSQQGQQGQTNGNGSAFGNPSSGGQSGNPSGGQERQTPWRQQAPFALDNPSAATQAPARDETTGAKPHGRSGLLA